jgi:drug/metabolite transporter (DMT)-like permease
MIWIILALIVAFLKSLWEMAGKIFTDEKNISSIDEYSLSLGTRLLSFIVLFPIALYIGIPTISGNMLLILFCSSVLGAIATITALKSVKYGDLSLVCPLSALTIPFLLVTSYFITKEIPNIYGFIWVSIIFLGAYFLQLHEVKSGFLWPIKAIYDDKWAKYMLITAIIWSITAPLDKLWVVELWALNWMFFTNALITVLLAGYMLIRKKSFSFSEMTQIHALKKVWVITILGWVWVFLQMLALKFTLVIYVIALKRASWMFSVFLWYFFFHEKNIIQKALAASIMLAWVIIIGIFGNI